MFQNKMITLKLEDILDKKGKTLYWLASPNGADVEYNSLWRLKDGRSKSISFELLDKLCRALECHPGEILVYSDGEAKPKRQAKKGAKASGKGAE